MQGQEQIDRGEIKDKAKKGSLAKKGKKKAKDENCLIF